MDIFASSNKHFDVFIPLICWLQAVVMRGFNSEDYPYICMDMFSELLKRYNVSSVAEYFKLSGCNMYKSVPAAGKSTKLHFR